MTHAYALRPTIRLAATPKLLALAAMLAGALLQGCAVNPATGGANLVLMTENKEKEIGLEEHQKVLESMSVYRDEALQAPGISSVGSAWNSADR